MSFTTPVIYYAVVFAVINATAFHLALNLTNASSLPVVF